MYLLEEIWDLLRSSPPDVVASMVNYLNGRLSNKSPIVKQKVRQFTMLQMICEGGRWRGSCHRRDSTTLPCGCCPIALQAEKNSP